MANEIQVQSTTGHVEYFLVRGLSSNIGLVWQTTSSTFVPYVSANRANYAISLTEQGTSGFYVGNFPSAIIPGEYSIVAYQQLGGSAADSDPTVGSGNFEWNGSYPLPRSDLATSGQLGQFGPIRMARGVMVLNFPIYLKSSADHVTPFTSGMVSGQISRDGGAFGPLQSGLMLETGLGFYTCTLTSGDLLANTVALLFTANGVSGGASDPLPVTAILQRVSGSL